MPFIEAAARSYLQCAALRTRLVCCQTRRYKSLFISVNSRALGRARSHLKQLYPVEIQAPENAIGRVYNCLHQHRAQIFSDEKRVGTPMFTIKAYLPVAESFGFNAQLRFQTSGQAFPQCVFDHWQVVDGCTKFLRCVFACT